ncbi:MAG: DUF2867 domain-containing protein [Fibrobacteres bacterium]|nr:DUF2867 domain-containing protein [Fibrobacterota bacterium]
MTGSDLPAASALNQSSTNFDYVDSFHAEFTDKRDSIDIFVLGEMFAQPGPKWFEALLAIRNKIASRFSLKTSAKPSETRTLGRRNWEIGEQVGIFRVFGKHRNELVLGENDRHLNFRVSLLLSEDTTDPTRKFYTVSTAVEFNNRLGRWYFAIVKPFHRLIVPLMIKRGLAKIRREHRDARGLPVAPQRI